MSFTASVEKPVVYSLYHAGRTERSILMDANNPSTLVLNPTAPATTACKCCTGIASLFGAVDFNKSCEDRKKPPLPLAGIPVHYHRCDNCGFIFTIAFDHFTPADFSRHIYNQQYILVDPSYIDVRPLQNAKTVHTLFSQSPQLHFLDYGGGSGQTARMIKQFGFRNVTAFDPFNPDLSARPHGKFDVVICFEVMEHTPTPRQTVADILSFVREPGVVLFSTLFQPADIEKIGLQWVVCRPSKWARFALQF